MPTSFLRRARPYLVLAAVLVAGYFINVEVQTRLGQKALAATGLASLPLPAALARAKAEGKPVLVDVSAIWCPSCRALDREVFANTAVRDIITKGFVFSRLEYETPEGAAFLRERGVTGFPNLWLLDGDGRPLRRLAVTLDPQAFLTQLAAP